MSPDSWRKVRLDRRYDWVGPPDKVSRIRPIRLRRAVNETETERCYREAREALNECNLRFWAQHNTLYEQRKAEFIAKRKKEIGPLEHVSANDLSQFYTQFMDERKSQMAAYNRFVEFLFFFF
ncbi:Mitochondrial APOPT family protein [Toxocara canis]|uniref:Mitochondrial APOPT family protein n=1 Tax=Toxocara canis TaxID=6265 RepID=A0A0B2V9P2_TOXCA|nr:Mitochondrial APOPT family protein [Toxocara canis]